MVDENKMGKGTPSENHVQLNNSPVEIIFQTKTFHESSSSSLIKYLFIATDNLSIGITH